MNNLNELSNSIETMIQMIGVILTKIAPKKPKSISIDHNSDYKGILMEAPLALSRIPIYKRFYMPSLLKKHSISIFYRKLTTAFIISDNAGVLNDTSSSEDVLKMMPIEIIKEGKHYEILVKSINMRLATSSIMNTKKQLLYVLDDKSGGRSVTVQAVFTDEYTSSVRFYFTPIKFIRGRIVNSINIDILESLLDVRIDDTARESITYSIIKYTVYVIDFNCGEYITPVYGNSIRVSWRDDANELIKKDVMEVMKTRIFNHKFTFI